MAKYRKKPVVVNAEQWFTDKPVDGVEYPSKMVHGPHGWIQTLEGGHIVTDGDFIITGVKGERYPCKPDIFEQTYETVQCSLCKKQTEHDGLCQSCIEDQTEMAMSEGII